MCRGCLSQSCPRSGACRHRFVPMTGNVNATLCSFRVTSPVRLPTPFLVVYFERAVWRRASILRNGKSSTVGYIESLHAKAIELSRLSVEMTAAADSGHPTSASSLAHIVAALMYGHMRYDPSRPGESGGGPAGTVGGTRLPHRVRGGLRVGTGSGEELRRAPRHDDWRRDAASGNRQRDRRASESGRGFPFFPAATGSLGQGLSIAAGLAAGARLDGSDKRIFCIIGTERAAKGRCGRRSTS